MALLRIRNGGVVSKQCSAFPASERTSWAEGWVGFQEMFGIGSDFETILSSPFLTNEWGLPGTAVLLTGDGHWWIALDYRAGDEPAVTRFDTEWDQNLQLAPSFRAFLEGLVPEEEFTGPPPDMDEPPPKRKQGQSSIGGMVMSIGQDIELFEDGRRSLENTRLWPRHRCADVLGHMWPWQTRRLRAALREVEAAQTPDELVERIRAIEPELDRLLRSWIRKRRPGWAGDEQRHRELKQQ